MHISDIFLPCLTCILTLFMVSSAVQMFYMFMLLDLSNFHFTASGFNVWHRKASPHHTKSHFQCEFIAENLLNAVFAGSFPSCLLLSAAADPSLAGVGGSGPICLTLQLCPSLCPPRSEITTTPSLYLHLLGSLAHPSLSLPALPQLFSH